MFIAHLPAGYLLTRALIGSARRRHDIPREDIARLMLLGLVASILPDFDLAWFYLDDASQHEHHTYLTHTPLWWLLIGLVIATLAALRRSPLLHWANLILIGNVTLHFVLDTSAGGIRWLYPFSGEWFVLAHIPKTQEWGPLNYMLHWIFLLEIVIVLVALRVWLKDRARGWASHTLGEILLPPLADWQPTRARNRLMPRRIAL